MGIRLHLKKKADTYASPFVAFAALSPLLSKRNIFFFFVLVLCLLHLVTLWHIQLDLLELDVDINNYLSELNESANEVKAPLGVRSGLPLLRRCGWIFMKKAYIISPKTLLSSDNIPYNLP